MIENEVGSVEVLCRQPSNAYCREAWVAVCASQAAIEFDTSYIVT